MHLLRVVSQFLSMFIPLAPQQSTKVEGHKSGSHFYTPKSAHTRTLSVSGPPNVSEF